MKIAHIIPPQDERKFDTRFCKFMEHAFVRDNFDNNIDLIYAGSVSVLDRALDLKRRISRPVVCWVWDLPYNWRKWGMDEEGIRQNHARTKQCSDRATMLRQCDLVISASKWTQSVLKEQYNIDSTQIYYYIDTTALDNVPDQERKKQVIQISRYYYNKRFEDSIEAMKDIPDYKLILIGTGLKSVYGNKLQEMAGPNVVFHNNVSRRFTIEQIKQSTILVSPSVFEGWGITPIEAVHCGTPIILSDLPVFDEVWGGSLYYHEQKNPRALSTLLKGLLKNETERNRILKMCKERITEFTPEKFAKRLQNLLVKL
jgi:glycosyltransferase involved in cell wall biosynthesis